MISTITRRSGDAGDEFDRLGGLGPEAQPLRGWLWDSIQSALDAAEAGTRSSFAACIGRTWRLPPMGIALHGHRAALEPDATPVPDRGQEGHQDAGR
jgi:hypothetical protein